MRSLVENDDGVLTSRQDTMAFESKSESVVALGIVDDRLWTKVDFTSTVGKTADGWDEPEARGEIR